MIIFTAVFLTLASALCFIEWGGEFAGTGGVLVAGTGDGKLGFIDVKDAQLLQVGQSVAVFVFLFPTPVTAGRSRARVMRHTHLCARR